MRGTGKTRGRASRTGPSAAGPAALAHVGVMPHPQRRQATDPAQLGYRSYTALAGAFLAAPGSMTQTGAVSGDHPVKYLIGLVAVGLFGWLGWVISRFGRDAATDRDASGEPGGTQQRAQLERLHEPSASAGPGKDRRGAQSRARSRAPAGGGGARGSASRPVGPEDDECFMRQLSEELRRQRAARQRETDADGTGAGASG